MKLRVGTSVAALIAALFAVAAHAVPTPYRLSPIHSPGAELDVIVDQVGQDYYIARDELKLIPRLRLSLVRDIAGRPGIVRLADVGSVRLDELQSELILHVHPEFLEPDVISNRTSLRAFSLPEQPPMSALMADYDLRVQRSNNKDRYGLFTSASTYVFGGRLDASLIAGTGIDTRLTHLRLSREQLDNSSLIEGGTIPALSGSRSSPGQIFGVGIRRDRGITPGYITGPQLRVNGIAQTQSTVEVLIDNQKTQRTTQPGPFSVVADPVGSGGIASVVVRDDVGNERVVTGQLWANPALLGIKQVEYALSAGGISTGGLKYDGLAAAGYYRRGITNWLTAEAGFEASRELTRVTAAADIATQMGNFAVDLSVGGGRSSTLRYVMPTARIGAWALTGSGEYATKSDDYRYINGTTSGPMRRYQKGLNFSATTPGWSVNSTLAATPMGKFFSASVGHALGNGASVALTAMRFSTATAAPSNSVFLSLSIPLGGRYLSLSAANTQSGLRKSATYGGRLNENVSASVNASGVHEFERIGADMSFRVGPANASVGVSKNVGPTPAAYFAALRGGLIAHAKGVEMSGPGATQGGFAVVDLGVPGVEVLNGFGSRATTNERGVAILRLPSLTKSKISIDPNTAPDNLDLSVVDTAVHRRGGVLITRRAEEINGQFLTLDGAKAGDILEVNGQRLPVTDRGVWVELPAGKHHAKIGARELLINIPSK